MQLYILHYLSKYAPHLHGYAKVERFDDKHQVKVGESAHSIAATQREQKGLISK